MDKQNVHVIPSDSSVDSYRVVDDADVVLTFGSTIGLEATYWGKTVVQVGHSQFEHLDVCYLPESENDIVDWLLSPPPPKPKVNVYPYIYSVCHGGARFSVINWIEHKAKFRNADLMIPSNGWMDRITGLFPSLSWGKFIQLSKKATLRAKQLLIWP
jgi:hypothetical protein